MSEYCFYGFDTTNTSQLVEVCVDASAVETNSTESKITDVYARSEDLDFLWVLLAGVLVFCLVLSNLPCCVNDTNFSTVNYIDLFFCFCFKCIQSCNQGLHY